MPSAPRTVRAYECDHLRPLVRLDGIWHHVLPDGDVGGWCSAGAYEVTATYEGEHYISRLVVAHNDGEERCYSSEGICPTHGVTHLDDEVDDHHGA